MSFSWKNRWARIKLFVLNTISPHRQFHIHSSRNPLAGISLFCLSIFGPILLVFIFAGLLMSSAFGAHYKSLDLDQYLRNVTSTEMDVAVLMQRIETDPSKHIKQVYKLFGPFHLAPGGSAPLIRTDNNGPFIVCFYRLHENDAYANDLQLPNTKTLSSTERHYLPFQLWDTLTKSFEYEINGTVGTCETSMAGYTYDQWTEYAFH